MLVIDGVELVLGNKPLKMWELECDHTVRSQKVGHPRGKVVEIGDLRHHIVPDDKVGPPALGHELLRERQAEELNNSGYILLARRFGHIGSWLDPDHRHTQRQKVLKEISVVACDFKHLTLRTEAQ